MAVTNSYIFRMFSPFSRLFFTFSDVKLPLQFFGFALIDGISGCHQFLGTQLPFKNAGCVSQGCFRFSDIVPRLTVARLAGIFSVSI